MSFKPNRPNFPVSFLVDSLIDQLFLAGYDINRDEVAYFGHYASFEFPTTVGLVSITLYETAEATVSAVCNGDQVAYPAVTTPHELFMHLGMAIEFCNSRKIAA